MFNNNEQQYYYPQAGYNQYDFNPCCDANCYEQPVVELPIEKCVKRDICHDVQHICPIHTKMINNHIYSHDYIPQYTCSEENIVTNLNQGSCCQFL